jgi:hypothetical protein
LANGALSETIIAALVVLSLAAGPVFAQTIIHTPHPGCYGVSTRSPALTGGGSLGHNRLGKHSSGINPTSRFFH